jgi:hypothetical protein
MLLHPAEGGGRPHHGGLLTPGGQLQPSLGRVDQPLRHPELWGQLHGWGMTGIEGGHGRCGSRLRAGRQAAPWEDVWTA